eukprot:1708825-Rhodomonas_salina.3
MGRGMFRRACSEHAESTRQFGDSASCLPWIQEREEQNGVEACRVQELTRQDLAACSREFRIETGCEAGCRRHDIHVSSPGLRLLKPRSRGDDEHAADGGA